VIARDKQKHLIVGFGIGLLTAWISVVWSLLIVAGIAALKEEWDVAHGTPDFWDWAWTMVGGVLGVAVWGLFI
jgi:uncharacterized membrane protein YphA (DoxX/SURF4 family)